jgi:hypothetical protein
VSGKLICGSALLSCTYFMFRDKTHRHTRQQAKNKKKMAFNVAKGSVTGWCSVLVVQVNQG